jgi:hypothetical protein
LTLSIRMYLWETNAKHSSHLQDLAGRQSKVGFDYEAQTFGLTWH